VLKFATLIALLILLIAAPSTPLAASQSSASRIAFTARRNGIDEIYVVKLDKSRPVRIAAGSSPSWSPDGQTLVYVGAIDKRSELFVVNVDNPAPRQLTHSTVGVADPAWSPDGKHIAYVSFDSGHNEIYLIDPDGGDAKRLTTNYGSAPAWTPDSSHIAYISIGQIYVMNADGSDSKRLVVDFLKILSPGISDVAYSPDGQHLAFTTSQTNHDVIYVANVDGSNLLRMVEPGDFNYAQPTWSPDGKQIAFTYYSTSREEIYIMNADGSKPTLLTSGYTAYSADW
jgi:Tol biopolymer transport system component